MPVNQPLIAVAQVPGDTCPRSKARTLEPDGRDEPFLAAIAEIAAGLMLEVDVSPPDPKDYWFDRPGPEHMAAGACAAA